MSPRQGLVLDVEATTPPILFHHGDSFRFEKLPSRKAGSSTRTNLSTRSRMSTEPSRKLY